MVKKILFPGILIVLLLLALCLGVHADSGGCAGIQYDGFCWFMGGEGDSCADVCEGHGGVDSRCWDDDSSCNVAKQFVTCESCGSFSYWGPSIWYGNQCYFRGVGCPDPDARHGSRKPLCACAFLNTTTTAPVTTTSTLSACDLNKEACDSLQCRDSLCGGGSCWGVGGEIPTCCGDSAGEHYITRQVHACAGDACPGFASNSGDDACCLSSLACVYNSSCHTQGDNPVDLGGEIAVCSISGRWLDSDYSINQCTEPYRWVGGGESTSFGEYDNGTVIECCGDDVGENYVTWGPGAPKCCVSEHNWVDASGNCVMVPINTTTTTTSIIDTTTTTIPTSVSYCDSCDSCSWEIQSASPGEAVYLTRDLGGVDGTCVDFNGSDNVTFNCQGHRIKGDGDVDGYGIYLPGNSDNNLILNCEVSSFASGIVLESSSKNTLTRNIVEQNKHQGVYLIGSSGNILTRNILKSSQVGVYVIASDSNTLTYNIVRLNQQGIYLYKSRRNILSENSICSNTVYDLHIHDKHPTSLGNSGDGNICDKPYRWNDEGTRGCTFPCTTSTIPQANCSDVNGTCRGECNVGEEPFEGCLDCPVLHSCCVPRITPGDVSPPTISNIQVKNITSYTAKIIWETDEESNSTVNYGNTTGLENTSSNTSFTTMHPVVLSNLKPKVTYYFTVLSTDNDGGTASDDNGGRLYSFTTKATTQAPIIQLIYPRDMYLTKDDTPDFGFILYGSEQQYSCELFINNASYGVIKPLDVGEPGTAFDLDGVKVYRGLHDRLWTPTANLPAESNRKFCKWGPDGAIGSCTGKGVDYPACNYCDTRDYAGFSDWYLPSCVSHKKDENCMMYQFVVDCGGYPKLKEWDRNRVRGDHNFYWTSDEIDGMNACAVHIDGGPVGAVRKSNTGGFVRCVRDLGDKDSGGAENNVLAVITANPPLSDGTHSWYIQCGAGGDLFKSEVREVEVNLEYSEPEFSSVLPGWCYGAPLDITWDPDSALKDYPLQVTLDTGGLISANKMRVDCGDIRFTDSDDSTLMDYWLEGSCNDVNTKIWVRVPVIPAGSAKTIYLYYGNPNAVSGSAEIDSSGVVSPGPYVSLGGEEASRLCFSFPDLVVEDIRLLDGGVAAATPLTYGETYSAEAEVRNLGAVDVIFPDLPGEGLTFYVGGIESSALSYSELHSVSDIPAGESRVYEFGEWQLTCSGECLLGVGVDTGCVIDESIELNNYLEEEFTASSDPPTGALTVPSSITLGETLTVTITGDDDVGVEKLVLKRDGKEFKSHVCEGAQESCTHTLSIPASYGTDGKTEYCAQVVDSGGQVADTSPKCVTVTASLPAKFDWSHKILPKAAPEKGNWMSGYHIQGLCGSCWAFSVVGAMEASYNIHPPSGMDPYSGWDIDLSEQYLISCSEDAGDCCWGCPYFTLGYVRDHGIPTEACFPYGDTGCECYWDTRGSHCQCTYKNTNNKHTCSDHRCSESCSGSGSTLWKITSFGRVTGRDKIKVALIERGPLVAGMNIWDWSSSGWDCGGYNDFNHIIIIVGYDEYDDYWIVRNSFDIQPSYLKVGYGECGIETEVYYVAGVKES